MCHECKYEYFEIKWRQSGIPKDNILLNDLVQNIMFNYCLAYIIYVMGLTGLWLDSTSTYRILYK